MNKTTAKKVEVRDEEAKKVRAAKRETFRLKLLEEKQSRLAEYRKMAPVWKEQAMAVEQRLLTQRSKRGWHGNALSNIRSVGPHVLFKKDADIAKLLVDCDCNTPYEACFLFLMGFYRAMSFGSSKGAIPTIEKMYEEVLHSDNYMGGKNRKMKKMKKEQLMLLSRQKSTIASYFIGATPFNDYEVDTSAMIVNFEAQSSYKNEEGESAVMEVRCAGVFPQFRKTRHCTMTFENGRWRAHDFSGLLVPVVKAFDPDERDEDEITRENEYRSVMKLPPRAPTYLVEQKSSTYTKVDASADGNNGGKPMDLAATKRRLAREKEEAKKEERLKGLSPEEREAELVKMDEEERQAKLERQRKAREATMAQAEANAKSHPVKK